MTEEAASSWRRSPQRRRRESTQQHTALTIKVEGCGTVWAKAGVRLLVSARMLQGCQSHPQATSEAGPPFDRPAVDVMARCYKCGSTFRTLLDQKEVPAAASRLDIVVACPESDVCHQNCAGALRSLDTVARRQKAAAPAAKSTRSAGPAATEAVVEPALGGWRGELSVLAAAPFHMGPAVAVAARPALPPAAACNGSVHDGSAAAPPPHPHVQPVGCRTAALKSRSDDPACRPRG